MLAHSQADSQIPTFSSATPWRPDATPSLDRPAMPEKLAMRDSFVASAFLGAYLALYLGVGFAGLAAVDWVWTYLVN